MTTGWPAELGTVPSVGVRDFRDHATEYLASSQAVAITRHGRVIGFYVPIPGDDREAVRAGAFFSRGARRCDGIRAASIQRPTACLRRRPAGAIELRAPRPPKTRNQPWSPYRLLPCLGSLNHWR